jgi:hypothetical protein
VWTYINHGGNLCSLINLRNGEALCEKEKGKIHTTNEYSDESCKWYTEWLDHKVVFINSKSNKLLGSQNDETEAECCTKFIDKPYSIDYYWTLFPISEAKITSRDGKRRWLYPKEDKRSSSRHFPANNL